MRKFVVLFMVLAMMFGSTWGSGRVIVEAAGTTYYVDSLGGSDGNNGTSTATPWKTVSKVNSRSFSPGDKILFKRGSVWHEFLDPIGSGNSSDRITYGAYGSGSLPVLDGSINKSSLGDWSYYSSNIWVTTSTINIDVGNIIFNDKASFGVKQWELSQLVNEDDYYYDKSSKKVFIRSSVNPASRYWKIELALNKKLVDFGGLHYVTFENLHLTKGAAHGFAGANTSNITIQDCEISYIGGGECPGLYRERYGNGVEFWGGNTNQLVQRCKIYEMYDTGLTNQNNTTEQQQENISYLNNIIWNCAMYSFEIWNNSTGSSTMKNIYFDNNTCLNAGMGWGSQRPQAVGFHLNLGSNLAATSNINIRNNIFFDGKFLLAQEWANGLTGWWSEVNMDYNNYFTSATYANQWPWLMILEGDNNLLGYNWPDGFGAYQTFTGFDQHSNLNYTGFADLNQWDLSLASNSPCIDAGTSSLAVKDYELVARPQGNGFDIGAYEFGGSPDDSGDDSGDTGGGVTASISIVYMATDVTSTQQIKPRIRLYNESQDNINLSEIKLRYYFTLDGNAEGQTNTVEWANIGSSNISSQIQNISGDAYYLELGFTSGAGSLTPGAYVHIENNLHQNDWGSTYDQTDDYSFDASATSFKEWNKITGYQNDVLIWGITPDGDTGDSTGDDSGDGSTGVSTQDVSIDYMATSTSSTQQLKPRIRLYNDSVDQANLSEFKIRYYFTLDGPHEGQTNNIEWSNVGSANITSNIVRMTDDSYYLELGFTSGAGSLSPGAYVHIENAIHQDDWSSSYDQSDDYSFDESIITFTSWNKITVYQNGQLAFGIEP